MGRPYSTRLVALTIGVSEKWLDNLLSHFEMPGVAKGRQGRRREIDHDGLLAIELARLLSREVRASLDAAVALAARAIETRSLTDARVSIGSGATLVFDLASVERRLHEQMVHAVESMAHVRRGRPPALTRSQSDD